MILVDIYVPAVNERYDFKVNENAPIARVVEEVGEILTSEYGRPDPEMIGQLVLCDQTRHAILPMNGTLKQNGLGNGSSLMLV